VYTQQLPTPTLPSAAFLVSMLGCRKKHYCGLALGLGIAPNQILGYTSFVQKFARRGDDMPKAAEQNLLPDKVLAINHATARNGKPTEYKIEGIRGLLLRVEPTGSAAFYIRYRVGGVRRRLRIGSRGATDYRDIKTKAREIEATVDRGEDPYKVAVARKEGLTFRELWDQRKTDDTARAARTMESYDQALHRYLFNKNGWTDKEGKHHHTGKLLNHGDIKASEITADYIASILREIARGSRSAAHAVRCGIGSTYRWAYKQRLVSSNPTAGLGFLHKAPARERELDPDDIATLWKGIETQPGLSARMRIVLKLLLLTGQRNSTVAGARVDELKLDVANPVWKIKGARMKVKSRDHALPLTPTTSQLFRDAIAMNGGSEFVFPSEGSGDHFDIPSVSRAMQRLRERIDIDDLRVHDFRKLLTSWLGERGVPYDVRTRIMHHSPPDVHSRNYDFSRLHGPMREALLKWEGYVQSCAGGSGGEILPMSRPA
jgi:integrase